MRNSHNGYRDSLTSSNPKASHDAEDRHPCKHVVVVNMAPRHHDNHERAEDCNHEFFAVDAVTTQCITKDSETDLTTNHTDGETSFDQVSGEGRDSVLLIRIVQVTEHGDNCCRISRGQSAQAHISLPSPILILRYPSPKRPTPATARNFKFEK